MQYYCVRKEWDKIINYSKSAYDQYKTEIGGMALMVQDEDGDWHLKDPVILKQSVTASNTHLDKEALAEYYGKTAIKMMKKKGVTYKYLWWHSHHTMGAFWSGTDQDTINEAEDMSDLSFSLVVNLKEEFKFRIALWRPLKVQQDVELNVEEKTKKVPNSITKEVEDLCEEPSTALSTWKYTGATGYTKQTNLWTRKPMKVIAPSEAAEPLEQAYEAVRELIKGACDGTVSYEKFDSSLDKISDALVEAGEDVMIIKVTKSQFEGGKLLGITEHDILLDETMFAYNAGYNVWGC